MIPLAELRIGNIVSFDLHNKVLADLEMMEFASRNGKPILFSEWWLIKFGFEVKESQLNRLYILTFEPDKVFEVCYDGGVRLWNGKSNWQQNYNPLWPQIKYVHQLQNLYFALTQHELKFSENILS